MLSTSPLANLFIFSIISSVALPCSLRYAICLPILLKSSMALYLFKVRPNFFNIAKSLLISYLASSED
nr:MAG TPA: hypothetical protein [Caudoviricetes sp.]